MVFDAWSGCQDVQVILALQPFLDDLHMQQAQKPAAEAKAQGVRCFRLIKKGSIVQLQAIQRIAQQGILVALHGI